MVRPLRRLPPAGGVLATALLLAFGNTAAANDKDGEIAALLRPESTFSLGVAHLGQDNARLGQYSGLTDKGPYGLLDLSYVRRLNDSGTWFRFTGRNLGLDSRELRFEHNRQGEWGWFIDYSRLPRLEPLVFNTGLSGIGTGVQAINGTALRDVELSTHRDRFSFGLDKKLPGGFDVQLRWRDEAKNGDRLFGRGSGQFLVEPIDSRITQLEASVNYTGERLQLSGGYYGTAFTNRHAFIDVATGADISLAPGNESHQLSLAGGYSFTPSTRATFKAAHGRGRQNAAFFTAPDFPGNTRTSLEGQVDTTQVQLGLSSRPIPRLSLLAQLRYDDRDDKTPRHQFLTPSTGRDGFNTPLSRTTTAAKLEAGYLLPAGMRLVTGIDVERRKRSVLTIRQASWRERNDETTVRVELRRSMSETINGALALIHSERDGSDYLPANNNAAADVIDPLHFADRKRDKVRLMLDWAPSDAASVQLLVDEARDLYDGRPLGPESGRARFYSLDGTYSLSEAWQIVGWLSRDDLRTAQSTMTGANGATLPAQTWRAQLRNVGSAFGAGLRGKPSEKLELGADVQLARDRSEYRLSAVIPAAAALPDIEQTRRTLKLFGQFALRPDLGLRVEVAHDRYRTDDWTWTNWVYADGTSVTQAPRGSIAFVGVSVIYRMW